MAAGGWLHALSLDSRALGCGTLPCPEWSLHLLKITQSVLLLDTRRKESLSSQLSFARPTAKSRAVALGCGVQSHHIWAKA
jgi:hypothetical protein